MNIFIKTIPHESQRYETVGDWYFDNEENPATLFIFVSDMGDKYKELLVARHELDEAMLCLKRDIKEEDVSRFDIQYELDRSKGDTSEPGDSPMAPYFHEHQIATAAEKLYAAYLKVDWDEYDKAVNDL